VRVSVMQSMNDDFPEERIARELTSGEKLLWSGRPRQGLVLRPTDTLVIPCLGNLAVRAVRWQRQRRFRECVRAGQFMNPGWGRSQRYQPPTFEGIPDARAVHDLIRREIGKAE